MGRHKGFRHSEATRAKIGAASKRWANSPEGQDILHRPRSDEARANLTAANRLRFKRKPRTSSAPPLGDLPALSAEEQARLTRIEQAMKRRKVLERQHKRQAWQRRRANRTVSVSRGRANGTGSIFSPATGRLHRLPRRSTQCEGGADSLPGAIVGQDARPGSVESRLLPFPKRPVEAP